MGGEFHHEPDPRNGYLYFEKTRRALKLSWEMTKPRVSAILPCFNHSHFLHERIGSILSQTRPVDEIIFLDDASTDESVSLARTLLEKAQCPVIIEHNSINSGSTFKQWNKGVYLASGDLVWIAETDDSCDSYFLETLLDCYQKNRATFAWTQSKVIDSAGEKLYSAREWHDHIFPGLFDRNFVMEGELFVRKYLSCINLIPNASAAIFSRKKYYEAGPANDLMRYAGDWLQWIKLVQGGRVCFLNQELNNFRCHPSTTRSSPDLRKLYSENIVCMTTALALTTETTRNIANTTSRIIIKPCTILSWSHSKAFSRFLLNSFSLNDIPSLNLRIRESGGLTYFSFGALFLLGYFAIIRLTKFRFNILLSRLRNRMSIFLWKFQGS